MKKFETILALLFLTIACGTETPEKVVIIFFEAYENSDGHALADCMDSEALSDINEYISRLKETPEDSAGYLTMIGVQVTAEDITGMTAGDFVTALFRSPAYTEELQSNLPPYDKLAATG